MMFLQLILQMAVFSLVVVIVPPNGLVGVFAIDAV